MNTSNLKPGQTFPNYRELCKALEIHPKAGGRNKDLHLKDLERYFSMIRKPGSYKITIHEIKEIPDAKLRRKGNKVDVLYFILLDNLVSRANEDSITKIRYTSTDLAGIIGFCNGNYFYFMDNYEDYIGYMAGEKDSYRELAIELKVDNKKDFEWSQEMQETSQAFNSFYLDGRKEWHKIRERILRAVRESGLIVLNVLHKVQKTKKGEFTWATEDENIILQTCEALILAKLSFKNKSEAWKAAQMHVYNRELRLLLEKEYQIFGSRKVYEFAFAKELKNVLESYKRAFIRAEIAKVNVNTDVAKTLERVDNETRKDCIDKLILLDLPD